MATAYISTSTELTLLNTTTRSGVIIMPSTNIPGRILTFKDTRGTFNTNPITFTTPTASQLFETSNISVTYNDPFGAYSFITGWDNKWYTIGGSRMNMAFISTINTINVNSINISSANITTSTLQFRDTSVGSTQTAFYQSSILYYSSPVSFFVVGPTKAPKPLFVPTRRPFSPNQISGLAFWFDASDPNTIVRSSGNAVRQWLDKSGRRNSATLANGTVTTGSFSVNNLNTVSFASAAQMNLPNITFTSGNRSIFLVANIGASGNLYAFLAGGTANTTTLLYIDSVNYLNYAKALTQILAGTAPSVAYNATALYSAKNVTNGLNVNGTAITLNQVNTPSAFNTGSAQEYLGQGPANATAAINYAEFLLYDSDLAFPGQQQQVEGYLAWKWGLVGNLPASHPYKYAPP
jgi:hypothetical protein